ncbi:thioester reductase-like protein [Cylindrospermum stagnale PCC 7417]|uniref:Thioester reductase-like protein n=1 Tax=Cylindrospermum stagnale PCC 7417 TaxID=56107 RepID=K9WSP1_9NOST|nr:thioester reductase domain-containing protein [Cylindrospermum stagnale]AFZ22819.1 thioester reductase-like protein [Cylindrospermum stagnale PCC 7417]
MHVNSLSWITLSHLLHYRALQQPNRLAYTYLADGKEEEVSLTYQELDQKARAIAILLQNLKAPGKRVLLLYPPGLEFIAAFFGCLYAGVIAVPVYPPRRNQRMTRLQAIAVDAQPEFALTTTSIIGFIEQSFAKEPELAVLRCLATNDIAYNLADDWQSLNVKRDTLAFLQYTSGSTGTPKGVMVSHKNLLHNSELIKSAFEVTPDSISLSWLPSFHDMGLLGGIIQPLYTGCRAILMSPTAFVQRPIRWLQAISRYRATHSGGPNFGYELCVRQTTPLEREDLDLSSWRKAYSGAEPVHKDSLEKFVATFKPYGFQASSFYPCYGMAEATLMISGGKVKDEPTYCTVDAAALAQNRIIAATEDMPKVRHMVAVGHTCLDTKIVIVDPQSLIECAPDQVGEIWVSGTSVADGYWQQPEQTATTFHASLINTGEGPFLRTGDLGFLRDGQLFVTGRLKDVVIIRGRNYYPQDIELTVADSHPALHFGGGAAFSIEVDREERLVVVQEVERTYWRQLNVDEVVGAIRQAVSEQHELQVYEIVLLKPGRIPKTSSGKIQRHACKADFINGSLQESQVEGGQQQPPLAIPSLHISIGEEKQSEKGLSDMTNTTLTSQEVSKKRADNLIEWVREYAKTRINSRLIDERSCLPPHITLDLGNHGFMGLQIPEQYKGLALTNVDTMRVMQQIAAIDSTIASIVSYNNTLGVRPIMGYATQTMKDELLPIVAQGREFPAFCLTEPNSGTDIGNTVSTIAVPNGHGGWRIRGMKRWNTSAYSGIINVFVRLVDDNNQTKGLTGFVMKQGMPGLRVGPESVTMGLRAMVQNSLYFDDVLVEPVNLLGELGNGIKPADEALFHARLGVGIGSLGGMKRCAQLMLRYASHRHVTTGRLLDSPITLTILTHLTGAITSLETLLNQVAVILDAGQAVPKEVAVVAKIAGSELLWQAADSLVQVLGGRGYMEANIAPQILRDARAMRIADGANEGMQLFLGKSVAHGEQLDRFLREYLGATKIADELKEAAEQIQSRCLKLKTINADDYSSARAWAYFLIGEVTIYALMLAAVRRTHTVAPSHLMQQAVAWSQLNFEKSLQKAVIGMPEESTLTDAKTASEIISSYTEVIDDIVQTLPGEDEQLDNLLLEQPQKAHYELFDLGKVTDTQNQSDRLVEQEKQHQPTASSASNSSLSDKATEEWVINWLAQKFNIQQATDTQNQLNGITAPEKQYQPHPATTNSTLSLEAINELNGITAPKKQSQPHPATTNSTLSLEAINEWIINWLATEFKIAATSITPSQSFTKFGLDSFSALRLVAALENWLQISLEPTIIWDFPSITALGSNLADKLAASNSTSRILLNKSHLNLNADTVLDPTICLPTANVIPVTEPDFILLTGATGFLGAFLLDELLKKTQAKIFCLVRADDIESGYKKIRENLKRYLLQDEEYNDRIIPFIGNLSEPLLGLSENEFEILASQIDVVYHCGALVNLVYPYDKYKATNVLGTQEILRLASRVKVKPVHLVSSYSIFLSQYYSNDEIIGEQDQLRAGDGIYVGYSQSKWVAEKLALSARSRGIPVSIYRLGDLGGHSQTGAFSPSSFTARFMATCIKLGSAPEQNLKRIDITPVDYVSQAIVHLSMQKESLDKNFHLVNPQPIQWRQLFDLIQLLGYPLERIPYGQWYSKLRKHLNDSPLHIMYPLLPLLANETTQRQKSIFEYIDAPMLDCKNVMHGLTGSSISCPPVDEKLLATYFSYFIHSNFL